MSSNTFLIDRYTRHQTYIQRYSTSERKMMIRHLNKTRKMLTELLGDANTDFAQSRFESLIQSVSSAIRDQHALMADEILINAADFANQELEYNQNTLDQATIANYQVLVPDYSTLKDAALETKIRLSSKQHNVRTLLKEFTDRQVTTVVNQLRTGVANGLTISQLRKQVLAANPKIKERRQADTLIRTVNNHISSTARQQVMEANQEVLEGFRVVATLDSRTTLICASKDQKVFDLDQPRPPYHYNCRSVATPAIKPEYQAAIPGLTTRAARIDGKTKQIGAYKTFGGYLSDQSVEFQKDYLGLTRYKLWKQGNLKLDKFVDFNDNELTLAELRAREPEAFNLAGIS